MDMELDAHYAKGGKYWTGRLVPGTSNAWEYSEESTENVLERLSRAQWQLNQILRDDETTGPYGQTVVRQGKIGHVVEAAIALQQIERYLPNVECWVIGYWSDWSGTGRTTWQTVAGFLDVEQAWEFLRAAHGKRPDDKLRNWQLAYGHCRIRDVFDPDAKLKDWGYPHA